MNARDMNDKYLSVIKLKEEREREREREKLLI